MPELSACSVDVRASRVPNCRLDANVTKPADELLCPEVGRGEEFGALHVIELDDVDVRKIVLAEVAKGSELGVGIVDALDECVLVRGAPSGLVNVLAHHVIEAKKRVLLDTGHEHVTRLLDGGVKRDCKGELLGLVGESLDHRDDATGGDGEVSRTNAGTLGGVELAKGAKCRVIVHERLALPHENDARDARVEVVADVHDLLVDLARGEGAGEARGARRAKGAAHGATGLGGRADRELVA